MRNHASDKRNRFCYISLQFLYWMMFCSIYGFATLFLIYFKVDPAKIGGILALVNIASTILQPFISQVIIKKSKVPLIVVLKTMTIGVVTVLLAGVIFPALSILTYVLGGILLVSMQSFLNALAFEYTNSGNKNQFWLFPCRWVTRICGYFLFTGAALGGVFGSPFAYDRYRAGRFVSHYFAFAASDQEARNARDAYRTKAFRCLLKKYPFYSFSLSGLAFSSASTR